MVVYVLKNSPSHFLWLVFCSGAFCSWTIHPTAKRVWTDKQEHAC